MHRWLTLVLQALAIGLVVPITPVFAQAGISTNPAPVETSHYLAAVRALSSYELESSKLALSRSRGQAQRVFAQQTVEHHEASLAYYTRLQTNLGTPGPGSALVGPLSEMLDSLQNAPPAEFAAAYRRGQIAAHEEALKLHRGYAARGSDPALRAKAQAAVPVVERQLAAARALPES